MNTLFWIMLTAFLVYAAGYLIYEFRQRLSEYRAEQARTQYLIEKLAPLENNRRPR